MSTEASATNASFVLPKAGAGVQSIFQITSPIPTPRAHEVLVRVHAVSLNYRDYGTASGVYPMDLKPNLVLGSDMAGEIVQVGEGVQGWKLGERVTANFDQGHLYGPASDRSELCFPRSHLTDRPNLSSALYITLLSH